MLTSKVKQVFLLLIYYLSPIIVSVIYWFEDPESLVLSSDNVFLNLAHRAGSILGITAFIWMCFNILMVSKFKMIEENFSLDGIIKFHTRMAAVAIFLSSIHYPLSRWGRTLSDVLHSGSMGWMIFIAMMVLAIIFMTNRGINHSRVVKMRGFLVKMKINYNVHKALHNLTLLGVVIIYIHSLSSITSEGSMLMRVVYSFFAIITFIGWGYHKLIRRFRSVSDPYIYRKASWDIVDSEIIPKRDHDWASKLIQENPSLYPCMQCGSCTATCPVSDITEGKFNPRKIIKNLIDGSREKILIDKEPNVWDCTHCYSCDEICPQGVRLSEVFNFLRNKFAEQKDAPEGYLSEAKSVYNFGVSIPLQSGIIKRREILNLPPRLEYNIQEIQDMMDMTGFNDLVEHPDRKEKKEEKKSGNS